MKKILKFIKNTGGQSLVEFALVLPILMLLILGMIEFGWILNGQITVTSAAREGARAAVVIENRSDPQAAASTAAERYEGVSSLNNVRIEPGDFTFDTTKGIAVVKVTATIFPIIGLYVNPSGINLTAKVQMRIE